MFIDKYKARIKKRGLFTLLICFLLGIVLFFISNEWQPILIFWATGIILFTAMVQANRVTQKEIGKLVELTNADYNDGTILYSGRIVDVMYYKPYKRCATIVDTRGYINSSISEDRGNFIVLFNRYAGEAQTGNRIVNTFVVKNDVNISDEKECLEYSDFFVFCNLKYVNDLSNK